MQEPTDPYAEWNRPLPGQPEALMPSYDWEELRDNALRAHTTRTHDEPVSLWLCSLNLYAFAFEQGHPYHAAGPEPGSPEDSDEAESMRAAYRLRLELLAVAGRATKPTLDLILSGYYTEAWTLLRTMLDGWARCIHIRLRHQDHVRWYGSEAGAVVQSPPNWGAIGGTIASRGNEEDKDLFKAAELRWEFLHMGVHPSPEAITQTQTDDRSIVMFRPEYDEMFCMHAFSIGVLVLRALLREVEFLGSHEEWWLRTNAKAARDAESLANSIQPALEEMAKRLEGKREERRKQRAARKERDRLCNRLIREHASTQGGN